MKLIKSLMKIYLNACYKLGLTTYSRNLISKNLKLDRKLSPDIVFKLAETIEEFEQAFSILYDNYVTEGYMQTNESKLRITAYHLLPTSMTLICKKGDEVIATCSIIKSSKFGMPTSEAIDLASYIPKGNQVAEIGSLAVKKSFQNKSGSILFPFIKYILVYCRDYLKLDYTVISHHPKWLIFYHLLFGFSRINPKTISKYSFANGAPVDFQILNMKSCPDLHCSYFYNYKSNRNIWKYIWKTELDNYQYPKRNIFLTEDNFLTPEMVRYFFVQKTNVFKNLPQNQKKIIKDFYRSKRFEDIFDIAENNFNDPSLIPSLQREPERRTNRLSVNLKANISIEGVLLLNQGTILNASLYGIQFSIPYDLKINDIVQFKVKTNEFKIINLNVRVRRKVESNVYGAIITGEATEWFHEISSIIKNYEDIELKQAI
jgi:hypothetical protein